MYETLIPKTFEFQTADILAFSGTGKVSMGIKIGTCSAVSHVGGIAYVPRWQLRNLACCGDVPIAEDTIDFWQDRHLLFESTTLSDKPCAITGERIEGVQAVEPYERIRDYHGRVWLYRLSDEWQPDFTAEDSKKLTRYLLAKIGTKYDSGGALLSGSIFTRRTPWVWRRVDRSSLFCSEYLSDVWQHIDMFPPMNSSEVTPGKLIRWLVRANRYKPGKLVKG